MFGITVWQVKSHWNDGSTNLVWLSSHADRRPKILLVSVVLAVIAASAASSLHFHFLQQTLKRTESLASIALPLRSARVSASQSPTRPEFIDAIPATVDSARVVRRIQASGSPVHVIAVTTGFKAPTMASLGRTEVAVSLKGTYPELKAWLSGLSEDFPGSIVQQLAFRRGADSTRIDLQADVLFLSRPSPAARGH